MALSVVPLALARALLAARKRHFRPQGDGALCFAQQSAGNSGIYVVVEAK